jgi:ligand-binding sensor domain-containing protein
MLKKYFFFFFLFHVGFAQQHFQEEWFSAELENIPQNSIKSMAPDKYGFIWMTTENGLLRFDGRNFKVFNSENSNLLSNRFTYITGSIENDSLRAATAYAVDEVLIHARNISKTKKSNKYNTYANFTTYEDLLYYNNHVNDPTIDYKKSEIRCKNGDYYLIESDKVTLFTKNQVKIKEVKKEYIENSFYFLHKEALMVLHYSENSYQLFSDGFSKTHALTVPKNAKILYNPTVQQLFIQSTNEILLLNKLINTFYFSTVYAKPNLNLNSKSMYYDVKTNKLFIGTLDKGLAVVSSYKFNTLINPLNVNNNYYGSFPISNNEFITSKGEVFNAKGYVATLNKTLTSDFYSIAVDQQKNIWIPNKNKIIKYLKSSNYKTFTTYTFGYEIATVYCDSKNMMWIGMESKAKNNAKVYIINASDANGTPLVLKNIRKPVAFFLEKKADEMLMVSEKELLIYNEMYIT